MGGWVDLDMKKILLIALLLIVGCSTHQKEYDADQIIIKENVYYKKFSDEICNGKVYTMFGDEKVYIGYLKDGKQDGLWSEWLENGQKRKETTYKDGIGNGLKTEWDRKGNKESEDIYEDGKVISRTLWEYYYDGQKLRERNWKDGILDGLSTKWYEKSRTNFSSI